MLEILFGPPMFVLGGMAALLVYYMFVGGKPSLDEQLMIQPKSKAIEVESTYQRGSFAIEEGPELIRITPLEGSFPPVDIIWSQDGKHRDHLSELEYIGEQVGIDICGSESKWLVLLGGRIAPVLKPFDRFHLTANTFTVQDEMDEGKRGLALELAEYFFTADPRALAFRQLAGQGQNVDHAAFVTSEP